MKETRTVSGITRNLSSALSAMRDLLALAGAAAIVAFLVLPLREPVEKALTVVVPSLPSVVMDQLIADPAATSVADAPLNREQQAVSEFIAKRYRVAEDAAGEFVAMAYRAGEQHRVDPLLILAVMAIESRYNPVAESNMGARGLMQVIPREARAPRRRAGAARARGQHPDRRPDPARVHAALRRPRDRAAGVRRCVRRADLALREQGVRREGAARRAQAQGPEAANRASRLAASSRSSMLRV
jgi:Transglycosylase SLT domain